MIRTGFVSNSSSSSFIVDLGVKNPKFSEFVSIMEGKLDSISKVMEMDECDLIYYLYKLMNPVNEYTLERIKEYPDEYYCHNTDKANDSFVEFTFDSDGINFNDPVSVASSIIEGYGLGHKIFSDFKYLEDSCH